MRTSAGALTTAAYVLGAFAALAALGVGGYRFGPIWCVLALAAGGAAVAAFALRRVPGRFIWATAVAMLGLAATGLLVDWAPPSRGVLARDLDQLQLPFFVSTVQVETGHSWCRPRCPAVSRTYRAPDTGDRATMLTVATALYHVHVIADVKDLAKIRDDRYLRVTTPNLQATVTIDASRGGRRIVHITYAGLKHR